MHAMSTSIAPLLPEQCCANSAADGVAAGLATGLTHLAKMSFFEPSRSAG